MSLKLSAIPVDIMKKAMILYLLFSGLVYFIYPATMFVSGSHSTLQNSDKFVSKGFKDRVVVPKSN